MDAEFWHQRWRRNEIGFHQREINSHLQSFWPDIGLAQGSAVFVPLCGKTSDMLWLRSQGHRVLGVEISPLAVESFFAENGLTPCRRAEGVFEYWECDGISLMQGDFFQLRAADLAGIEAVFDRASLVALPPAMRRGYAGHMRAILPVRAQMLLVTMEYPQEQMQGPPFTVEADEIDLLYADRYAIRCLFTLDVMAENPRFRDRGITRMAEKVFLLRSKP